MNARGRIAEAIRSGHFSDGEPNEWLAADAVLAVLPDLLTDPQVVDAVAAVMRERASFAPTNRALRGLEAAAKALTRDTP